MGKLFLNQHNYIEKVLKQFTMKNCKPVNTLLLHTLNYLHIFYQLQSKILNTCLVYHIAVQLGTLCATPQFGPKNKPFLNVIIQKIIR